MTDIVPGLGRAHVELLYHAMAADCVEVSDDATHLEEWSRASRAKVSPNFHVSRGRGRLHEFAYLSGILVGDGRLWMRHEAIL